MGKLFDNPIADTLSWAAIIGSVSYGGIKFFKVNVPIINEINIQETVQTSSQQDVLPDPNTNSAEVVEKGPHVTMAKDSFGYYNLALTADIQQTLSNQEITSSLIDVTDQSIRLDFTDPTNDHNFAVTTIGNLLTHNKGSVLIGLFDTTVGGDCVFTSKKLGGSFGAAKQVKDLRVAYTSDSPSQRLWTITRVLSGINDGVGNNIEVGSPKEALTALQQGRADVAVLWQPECSQAYDQGFYTLISTQNLRGYIVDVIVASEEYAKNNPKVVQAYTDAHYGNIHSLIKNNQTTDISNIIGQDHNSSGVRMFTPLLAKSWYDGGSVDRAIKKNKSIEPAKSQIKIDFSYMLNSIAPYVEEYEGVLSRVQKAQKANLLRSPAAQPMRLNYDYYKLVKSITYSGDAQKTVEGLLKQYPFGSYMFRVVVSGNDTSRLAEKANSVVVGFQDYSLDNQLDFKLKKGQASITIEVWEDVGG